MSRLRRIVFWIGWNVPLWHLNPHLIAFGIGAKSYKRELKMKTVWERKLRGADGQTHTAVKREHEKEVTNLSSETREFMGTGLYTFNLKDGREITPKDENEDEFVIKKTGEILRATD